MSSNGYLGRGDFLKLSELKRRYSDVQIDGFGKIRIQSLSEREASQLRQKMNGDDKATLICACVVDEEGNRLFRDTDSEKLSDIDASVIDLMFQSCADHINASPDFEAIKKN